MKQSNTKSPQVVFAGAYHGGIAGFTSLQATFESIEVLSDDDTILSMMRDSDIRVDSIEASQSPVVVCAAYQYLIGKDVLSYKTIINTHPALLPKYRGVHGLAWAMLNLEKELGFTIHLMNEYVDDGDILEQFKHVYGHETSKEILDMFDKYVVENLGRVVLEYMKGEIIPVKQNRSEATWVTKRNLTDCIIDFDERYERLEAVFRVLAPPYPYPMLKINDKLYEILNHQLLKRNYEMRNHNGRVVNIEDEDVFIKTQDGLLIINQLRDFDSKKMIPAREMLYRGQRLYDTPQ